MAGGSVTMANSEFGPSHSARSMMARPLRSRATSADASGSNRTGLSGPSTVRHTQSAMVLIVVAGNVIS